MFSMITYKNGSPDVTRNIRCIQKMRPTMDTETEKNGYIFAVLYAHEVLCSR